MQIDRALYDQIVALIEEGIREGQIYPAGSAEEADALTAQRALGEDRLFRAARAVSGLLSAGAWDHLRDLVREAGQPADAFAWDTEAEVFPPPLLVCPDAFVF